MRYLFLILVALFAMPSYSKAEITTTSFADRFFDRSDYVKPWNFHFKLNYAFPMGEEKLKPGWSPDSSKPLEDNFYGVGLDFQRNFTDYLGLEFSSGYMTDGTYDSNINGVTGSGRFAIIPVTASLMFHPAPYGTIDPYIGFGGGYYFVDSTIDSINASGSTGEVIKLGFDWLFDKNTSFNFEIKKEFFSIDTEFENNGIKTPLSTADVNPLTTSIGIGYKF